MITTYGANRGSHAITNFLMGLFLMNLFCKSFVNEIPLIYYIACGIPSVSKLFLLTLTSFTEFKCH